jgi:hypothetical protein
MNMFVPFRFTRNLHLVLYQEQIGIKLAIPDNMVQNHNAKCFKCNRNVQSRAVFCDKGQQWVHYRCLKPV